MVTLWGWGEMSAQTLQHLMTLFKADLDASAKGKLGMDLVNALLSLGTDGAYGGNMHRDLLRRLPRSKLPQTHTVTIPLKHSVLQQFTGDLEMLLPHEMLASLYHDYNDAFCKYILPEGLEGLQRFWDAVKGDIAALVSTYKDHIGTSSS